MKSYCSRAASRLRSRALSVSASARACRYSSLSGALSLAVVSAMIASLAGSLYAHFQALVAPTPFNFQASVELVVMATVGGMGTIWGAPVGVAVVCVVREILRARLHALLHMAGGEHEMMAYGIILVLIRIFMPKGLTPALAVLARRVESLRPQHHSRHVSEQRSEGAEAL